MYRPIKHFIEPLVPSITIMMLVTFGLISVFTSDGGAKDQVQAQSTLGGEIRTDKHILTKSHVNGKMFYYVQFLKDKPQETCPPILPIDVVGRPQGNTHGLGHKDIDGNGCTEQVWLTIQLGYVPDGSEQFMASDTLSTSEDGVVFADVARQSEFERWPGRFFEAIGIVEARYEAMVRVQLLELKRWLDNKKGPAPVVNEKYLLVLQELHKLKAHLFEKAMDSSRDK